MSSESIREKMAKLGGFPALSDWRQKTVLLYRCQDIDRKEFLKRVQTLYDKVESLFQQSLPESMETESYLVAQEYYDTASDGLDCYLNGLEALLDWAETGDSSDLERSSSHFARGDEISREVLTLALEVQESFRETDEALLRSLGVNLEGID